MPADFPIPTVRADLEQALQRVNRVLAGKDADEGMATVSEQFSEAVGAMVRLRDGLIPGGTAGMPDDRRDGAARPGAPRLAEVNALISLMAGIEFPLGGIHWPRIERVSAELQKMLKASEPASTS